MAGKLDQSLDEILSTRRTAGRGRGRAGRRTVNGRTAPAGGIQKNTAKTATKVAGKSTGTVPAGGDSKIIVSNLVRPPHRSFIYPRTNAYSLPMSPKARSRYVEQRSESVDFSRRPSHFVRCLSTWRTQYDCLVDTWKLYDSVELSCTLLVLHQSRSVTFCNFSSLAYYKPDAKLSVGRSRLFRDNLDLAYCLASSYAKFW